jgi:hypothetical protein
LYRGGRGRVEIALNIGDAVGSPRLERYENEGSAKNPPKGKFVREVLYVAATLRQRTQGKKPRPTKLLKSGARDAMRQSM